LKEEVPLSFFISSGINTKDRHYKAVKKNFKYNKQEDMVEYTREDGVKIANYTTNGNRLLEAVNASYDDINNYTGKNLESIKSKNPKAIITTRKVISLIGTIEETDVRGRTTYYVYDEYGNLAAVKDHDKNIVKASHRYLYNYTELPNQQQHKLISNPDKDEYLNKAYAVVSFSHTGELKTNYDVTFSIDKYKPYLTYKINFGRGKPDISFSSKKYIYKFLYPGNYNINVKAYLKNGTLISTITRKFTIEKSYLSVKIKTVRANHIRSMSNSRYRTFRAPVLLEFDIKGGVGKYTVELKYNYSQYFIRSYRRFNKNVPISPHHGKYKFSLINKGYYKNIYLKVSDEKVSRTFKNLMYSSLIQLKLIY
jgi:YD repeat-containing protein